MENSHISAKRNIFAENKNSTSRSSNEEGSETHSTKSIDLLNSPSGFSVVPSSVPPATSTTNLSRPKMVTVDETECSGGEKDYPPVSADAHQALLKQVKDDMEQALIFTEAFQNRI